jgi:hypothetical protein
MEISPDAQLTRHNWHPHNIGKHHCFTLQHQSALFFIDQVSPSKVTRAQPLQKTSKPAVQQEAATAAAAPQGVMHQQERTVSLGMHPSQLCIHTNESTLASEGSTYQIVQLQYPSYGVLLQCLQAAATLEGSCYVSMYNHRQIQA